MSRKIPVQPVNREALGQAQQNNRLMAHAKLSADWGKVEDAGGGYIRIRRGLYRVEGKGVYQQWEDFSVLTHDGKSLATSVPLMEAVQITEAAIAADAEVAAAAQAKVAALKAAKAPPKVEAPVAPAPTAPAPKKGK